MGGHFGVHGSKEAVLHTQSKAGAIEKLHHITGVAAEEGGKLETACSFPKARKKGALIVVNLMLRAKFISAWIPYPVGTE